MDAGEDRDLLLQRSAASYIEELKTKLPKLLFRSHSSGALRVRSWVRASTTQQICNYLEPFQEWPQLLDPHLAVLIRPLQDALLQSSYTGARSRSIDDALVIPLEQAACKLLYTFCKVRGPKVVSRFLENGAENLELALNAFEAKVYPVDGKGSQAPATWEEKYIYMLWISHLLFAPFDLTTVGSEVVSEQVSLKALRLPKSLPAIAVRLIHVGIPYLTAAGKEREAAVKLLSRLAARPDMQRLGLHDCLLSFALSALKDLRTSSDTATPYDLIGCLSLVAGILSALDATALRPYILNVFKNIRAVITNERSESVSLTSTAVSRKLLVKILRLISTLALHLDNSPESSGTSSLADYVLEEVIDHLLQSLADKDTPVRQAASKAISFIASKLQPDMAAEVVEAVIGSLDENVLWLDDGDPHVIKSTRQDTSKTSKSRRDLSAVNPLRWHGLVLTLSQLLFQRSAPPSQLPTIIHSLILGLTFEQRAGSGSSVGSNVRDAANFGVWSIARKYSTQELIPVDLASVRALHVHEHFSSISIIQALAAELVVAATLDPTGNIRRGSSAALQELIGRHPDAVFEGIPLVQVVDYHAVALRSKAFFQVAIRAAQLHEFYWRSILHAAIGWRGLEAADAPSRRLAAESIGLLSQTYPSDGPDTAARLIYHRLEGGRTRDVERRHGLLLAAARLVGASASDGLSSSSSAFWALLEPGTTFEYDDLTISTRRPELTAEAVCELISALTAKSPHQGPPDAILDHCMKYLSITLERRESIVIAVAGKAVKEIFRLLDNFRRNQLVTEWIHKIESRWIANDTGGHRGYLTALGSVYDVLDPAGEESIQDEILGGLIRILNGRSPNDVDTRVAALAALNQGVFRKPGLVEQTISQSLEQSLQDYTVDERGDIGSLVRLEALGVVRKLLVTCEFAAAGDMKQLLTAVVILAGEKLDKVRFAAWRCLEENWAIFELEALPQQGLETANQTSSVAYFAQLLRLLQVTWLRRSVIRGLCSSAGAGSESVLRAARSALVQQSIEMTEVELLAFATTLLSLFRDNLDHDRLTVPILETWAFLLQSALVDDVTSSADFTLRRLFAVAQKAHYKSGNLQKLTAAVQVYAGLAMAPWVPAEKSGGNVREEAVDMLVHMLQHPLPKVRNAAADALYVARPGEGMLTVNWTARPVDLKGAVNEVRLALKISRRRTLMVDRNSME